MKNGGLDMKLVEARLREFSGNMAAVARSFGVTRQAVWEFVQKREKLKAITVECREALKDNAESALHSAILKGEAWAICFFLKTQAKDRGYIERGEVQHSGEVRQRVIEEVVNAPPGGNDDSPPRSAEGVPPE
jgi:hypothetical protein